ncbi:MAG TPA: serine hydrolase domain-containing protein [Planctomycetota bacterium]|nr:serine hydrolase domain-containing protein [Planctomycetota bacterium]
MTNPFAFLLLVGTALQEPSSIQSFDEAMDAQLREYQIPGGALAVSKNGRLVHAKGYGLADVDQKTPVEPDALFRIASLSKPITAVAVLKLAQDGRLDLDAKAFSLLDLDLGKADPRLVDITVRELLDHTGGWDREKSGDPMFRPFDIASALGVPSPPAPSDLIRFMIGKPLDFDPGTRHAYSNFGYCVLGRIIEKISGEPYEDHVRKAILAPMGITRMRLGKTRLEERSPGEVRYYPVSGALARSVFESAKGREVPWPYGGFCLESMDAHGGWLASAPDLVRFACSIEKVLDAKSRALLLERPKHLEKTPVYYACGWMVRTLGAGKQNVWHNGSLPGTSTLLVIRHDGLVWAALFNDRSRGEGKIDPALHKAADAVVTWPREDLFGRFR